MASPWSTLIERIHSTPHQVVVAVTGGGVSGIAELLAVPGGSKTLLEAIVPYSEPSLVDFLGRKPDQFCSEDTALGMAACAYQRALRLVESKRESGVSLGPLSPAPSPPEGRGELIIGLGCTASLATSRPKRGPHRVFIATHGAAVTTCDSLVLEKDVRSRADEETVAGQLLLRVLARACSISAADLPPLELRARERVISLRADGHPWLAELCQGSPTRRLVWSFPDGHLGNGWAFPISIHESFPIDPNRKVNPTGPFIGLLPGAFNPLHDGHRELRSIAEAILGGHVAYEMSVTNVDKPPLDFFTLAERRTQFTEHPVVLTNAPTFAEKAAVLPGTTFVVGADTAERIVQPKYYGHDPAAMAQALSSIRANRCRFLVAGRAVGDRFVTLADLAIPPEFADLFAAIPADRFRKDISSTSLRSA
ncbi:MAG: hypothetical protein HZA46_20100 [Planctomycetales bacterium]|nr:hypothetical protein [Planctomycetales bacterium]